MINIQFIRHVLMLGAAMALVVSLSTEMTYAGVPTGDPPFSTAKSQQGSVEGLSDYALAYQFLSARETLNGQLGVLYQNFKTYRQQGVELNLSINYIVRNPDGSSGQVTLKNLDELEHLIGIVEHTQKTYAQQIRVRGTADMKPRYRALVSEQCPKGWIGNGEVLIQQDDLSFTVKQGEKTFEGIAIGETVTVAYPGGQLPPLTGTFMAKQHITLGDAQTSCDIRLIPNDRSANRVGG